METPVWEDSSVAERGWREERDRDRQNDKESQRQREEGLRPGRVAQTCSLSTYKARGVQ